MSVELSWVTLLIDQWLRKQVTLVRLMAQLQKSQPTKTKEQRRSRKYHKKIYIQQHPFFFHSVSTWTRFLPILDLLQDCSATLYKLNELVMGIGHDLHLV